MFSILCTLLICAKFHLTISAFSSPQLFWGSNALSNLKYDTFNNLNKENFKALVKDVEILLIFSSKEMVKVDKTMLPRLDEIIKRRDYLYLPHSGDDVDLFEDINSTKIIHIDLKDVNLDNTISDEYLKFEQNYGSEKVLALLVGPSNLHKKRIKREDSSKLMIDTPFLKENDESFIYNVIGKSLFYTKHAPVLRLNVNNNKSDNDTSEENKEVEYELKNHDLVTLDDRDQLSRLIITFKLGDGYKVTLRFRFPLTLLSWSLTSVELEDSRGLKLKMPVVSIVPSAPMGFSHKCVHPLVFRNGSTSLTMFNVQVQPTLKGQNRFGDAYNCIGFTTVPIWSGMLVSSLILGGLAIAILAIMDIRTPTKFETTKSKLTIINCN